MLDKPPNSRPQLNIPAEDLDRCHSLLGEESWQALRGKSIFITGGTGFIGKWLLATLLDADERFGLGCQVSALSRNPTNFQRAWPETIGRIEWIAGDVRTFEISKNRYDVIIHAATDVVAQASHDDVFSACVDGTRRVLSLAQSCGATQFLLVSSGAIYGLPPIGMTRIPETYTGGPDPLLSASAYGEGKRVSEWLASQAVGTGLSVKVARIFTLVGPHLPQDKHYAIGNFIRAALSNERILITGDGTPHRSYLYAADMAAWLWTVLFRGKTKRAYNVGSDDSISIAALAERVCLVLKRDPDIVIMQRSQLSGIVHHYVPDITRSRSELGMSPTTTLDQAILLTARNSTVAYR